MAPATDKIRVLIVDDIPETRENVRKLLAFEADVEVVGVAGTGREAVQLARDLQPNIVMMDINMPDMDGITAVEMITRDVPIAQVIMMSVQSEADYLRRSMLAGARDFLTKPFTSEDLVSTILSMRRYLPDNSILLYNTDHGLGWNDPGGWRVFFGSRLKDMDQKLLVYQSVVDKLNKDGVTPTLISVEYLHAPYYRVGR